MRQHFLYSLEIWAAGDKTVISMQKARKHCKLSTVRVERLLKTVSCHTTGHFTHMCTDAVKSPDWSRKSVTAVEINLMMQGDDRWQVMIRQAQGYSTTLPSSNVYRTWMCVCVSVWDTHSENECVVTETHRPSIWESGYDFSTLIKRWKTLWNDVTVVSGKMEMCCPQQLTVSECVCVCQWSH